MTEFKTPARKWEDDWDEMFVDFDFRDYTWQDKGKTIRAIEITSQNWFAESVEANLCCFGDSLIDAMENLTELLASYLRGYPFGSGLKADFDRLEEEYFEGSINLATQIEQGLQPDREVFIYRGEPQYDLRIGKVEVAEDGDFITINASCLFSVDAPGYDVEPVANVWKVRVAPEERGLLTVVLLASEVDSDVSYGWPKVEGYYLMKAMYPMPEINTEGEIDDAEAVVQEAERIVSFAFNLQNIVENILEGDDAMVKGPGGSRIKTIKNGDLKTPQIADWLGVRPEHAVVHVTQFKAGRKNVHVRVWGLIGETLATVSLVTKNKRYEATIDADEDEVIFKNIPSDSLEGASIEIKPT